MYTSCGEQRRSSFSTRSQERRRGFSFAHPETPGGMGQRTLGCTGPLASDRPPRRSDPGNRHTQRRGTAGPARTALTFLDILSLSPSPGTTPERPQEPRTDSRPQPRRRPRPPPPPPPGSPGPPASEPLPARGAAAMHAGTRSSHLGTEALPAGRGAAWEL